MTVLRRGYVPVEPDTDGFDEKLKEQFRKSDPGGKAGKQLGGQLNRALKRVNLDAIDIKADPKDALAKIELTERKLRGISERAATIEIKVAAERALGQLERFKKQLGDIGKDQGDEAATGFSARFGARIGPLLANVAATPPVAAGGALIGAAMAPTVAAAVSGAIVGGAGIGGVIGGIVLASRDPRVQSAGKELGQFVLGDLTKRSTAFVPATLDAISRVRQGFADIGPDLDRVFKSSRFVAPLTDGAIKGAKGFVSGFADAIDKADPIIDSLSTMIAQVGTVSGNTFRLLAGDAKEGASAIDDLTISVSNLITTTGGIIHAGAAVKGWADQLDIAIDKGRYWIEDNSKIAETLKHFGVQLDITADGFKAGSVEAEAYRRATLGTADASDFAILKTAGMSDAQISATDASGKYRSELERVKEETLQAAGANSSLMATEDDVKEKTKASTVAQQEYTRVLDSFGVGAGNAARLVDGLRKATTGLYGAQELGIDANEAYEASWDSLSEAVKKNKGSLDVHSAAGRANRDALQALLATSREMYFADINAGVAIDEARKKHEKRTGAIEREAGKLGLNRKATQDLIGTYGRIPAKKETDLVLAGMNRVVKALEELYIYQRALAEGIPVASVRGLLSAKSGPQNAGKGGTGGQSGHADGGWTGPGSKYQPAGIVHADEFVIKKASRRKIEAQNPGLLAELNATGQVPGHAAGGLVAPVDTSRRWPFVTTARGTDIPSRAKVAARVVPAFSKDWPSSPSAQRGDSGVWRRVVALIRSTGPLSGSFGNAYRPGDPKWHGSGRAVDWMGYNQDALASFLAARRPLELIHRTRNRDYAYTRGKNKGSFNNALMEAHRNHVHIAMANGGVIREPVAGVGLQSGASYSFGERGSETVSPGEPGGGDVHIHFHDSVIASRQQAEDLVVAGYTAAKKRKRL
jgi:hypothetical protein